jgi:hypothetical protein
MAQAIYKVWMAKYTEAWYQLSADEQQAHNKKVNEALKKVGGESVIFCVLPGGQPWIGWGVEKFPDMEALQQHTMLLFEMNHMRYSASQEYIGTEIPRE